MNNAEREKHDRFLRLYVENEESLNGLCVHLYSP